MRVLRRALLGACLVALALASLPAQAAPAARTRGGSKGTRSHASAPVRGTAPRHVEGRATWRHGSPWRWGFWGGPSPWLGWGWHLGWDASWWSPYGPGPYWEWGPYARDVEVVGDAWIETDVRPKRATVRLDGEDVGIARDWNGVWDRLPVEPGAHVLEFVLEGHQTLQVHVDARAGRIYHIDRELRRGEGLDARSTSEPPRRAARENARPGGGTRGHVRLSIEPGDAAVYLDGRFLGRASELRRMHGATSLAAGEHELEVVRPGFRPERRRLSVDPEDLQEVRIELQREDGGAGGDEEEGEEGDEEPAG